jgi:peptidoglycan/xylan/chitin deacetylase (PgdA/CDA1 family)
MAVALVFLLSATSLTAESKRRIALTFDDAPRSNGSLFTGAERTERLIDALKETGVEGAVFFVTTRNLEQVSDGEARLRAYVDNGHYLGNHSHSHLWLWRSAVADYLSDLDQANQNLRRFDGLLPLYRFPFLDEGKSPEKRDALRSALAERGLKNGYVTVDNYEWYMNALLAEAVQAGHTIDEQAWCTAYTSIIGESVEFYDAIARDTLGRSPDHVLLLHENDYAALCLVDLINALREAGWAIIPATQAYQDPISDRVPETLFNGQGRVAALAHERGRSPRSLVHASEDKAWLRQRFSELGLLPSPALSDTLETTR